MRFVQCRRVGISSEHGCVRGNNHLKLLECANMCRLRSSTPQNTHTEHDFQLAASRFNVRPLLRTVPEAAWR